MKRGRQSKAERAAIAAMSPADLREPWQIEQAARCGCKGTDDMCPCQNENPWPLRNGWRPIGGLPRVFRRLGNETEEGCYDTDWVLCGRWNGKFFTTWVGMLDADEWLGRDDHASCFETDEPEVWQPLPAPPSAHPLPSTASAAANQKPSDVKPPVVGEGENLSDKACPRCGAGNPELDVEFCGDRRCPYRPQPRLVPPHSPDPDATIKSVVESKGYCFECGHELHAPFCPACNPELATPSPREAGLREDDLRWLLGAPCLQQREYPGELAARVNERIDRIRQALSSGDRP